MHLLRSTLPLIVLFCCLLTACQPSPHSPTTAKTWFDLKMDGIPFRAQLAITPSEMTTGLMHRSSLGENDGMLFIYESPGQRSFWMKNTHIPLDVGFFTADGILRQISPMRPNDLTPIPSHRNDIVYALEMNHDWFTRNNLLPGASLDIPSLRNAIEKRSFAQK